MIVTKVQLETVGSIAALTGSISQFEAPHADLVVRAIVNAARAAPLANIKDPVGGELTVDATAKGPLATPAVTAHVSGSSLQFRELRDIELDAQAAYDSAARRMEVSSLRVRGLWGAVNGSGTVALDTSERSQLRATVDSLDAGRLMWALLLPYSAATRVDGTVSAEWPGLEYLKAHGNGQATLRPTAPAASRSQLPIGGRVLVRANAGHVDAQVVQVVVAGTQLDGRVAVTEDRRLLIIVGPTAATRLADSWGFGRTFEWT